MKFVFLLRMKYCILPSLHFLRIYRSTSGTDKCVVFFSITLLLGVYFDVQWNPLKLFVYCNQYLALFCITVQCRKC